MASLGERVHLRNRLGLQVAFCEDPLLEGMLEGVAMKGMTKGLKKAAQAEALEAAKQAGSTEKREQEARTLIGPKGGLPTLRRDLLKLAALLRVDIAEDTVDTIKEKVKPMVNLLKEKPVPKLTAVKSAAEPRGAQPKSSAKEASASSLSADVRPISNLTEQHEALKEIVGKMAQEMQVAEKPAACRRHWQSHRPDHGGCENGALRDVGGRDGSSDGGRLCRALDGNLWNQRSRSADGGRSGAARDQRLDGGLLNPYTINQTLKKGQAQMIAQAWARHEADRLRTSWGPTHSSEPCGRA